MKEEEIAARWSDQHLYEGIVLAREFMRELQIDEERNKTFAENRVNRLIGCISAFETAREQDRNQLWQLRVDTNGKLIGRYRQMLPRRLPRRKRRKINIEISFLEGFSWGLDAGLGEISPVIAVRLARYMTDGPMGNQYGKSVLEYLP